MTGESFNTEALRALREVAEGLRDVVGQLRCAVDPEASLMTKEAAAFLRISQDRLNAYAHEGLIDCFEDLSKGRTFTRRDLIQFRQAYRKLAKPYQPKMTLMRAQNSEGA